MANNLGGSNKLLGSIYAQCFPAQLAFATDNARRKTALTSRRAGKTQAIVRMLVAAALRVPESICYYLASTDDSAEKILWKNPEGLPAWLRRNRVDCIIREDGSVTFPNGSVIWVTGAQGRREMERRRGIRTDLVCIDEAQVFADAELKYLVEEIISPTQMDRGGQLSLSGTPHGRCSGYFYEATTAATGWTHHTWDWSHNPHLRDAQKWVAEEKRLRGLTDETPAFRREFRGEWVREDSSLAYRFEHERNTFTALPAAPEWTHILGIDVGFNDAAAFSLGCYHSHSPVYFVREVYQEVHCLPSRYDAIIKSYKAAATAGGYEINRIVMDCGALAKVLAEQLRHEYHHNITPAEKTEKRAFMAFLNDALRAGTFKVDPKRCKALIEQWGTLQVDEFGDEDQSQPNDLSDATLYAFRHARAYLAEPPPPPKPHPGRRPAVDPEVEAARMRERAETYVERQQAAMADMNGLLGEFETLGDGLFE